MMAQNESFLKIPVEYEHSILLLLTAAQMEHDGVTGIMQGPKVPIWVRLNSDHLVKLLSAIVWHQCNPLAQ